jgi:hypothetical protein
MKPILVKNQSEWNRLAPVLEALRYVWFKSNEKPTEVDIWGRWTIPFCIIIKGNEMSCTANLSNFQTVDEYLQAQEPTSAKNATIEPDYKALYEELLAKHEKPCDPQRLCCHNATQKLKGQLGESVALYETLLQGVKDAKAEMVAKAIKADEIGNKLRDNDYHFTSNGISLAIKILTDKTGIL